MKGFSDDILDQADKLTKASKSLDYKRIAAHDEKEITKLNNVLNKLKIKPIVANKEALDNYANKNPAAPGAQGSDLAAERRELLTTALISEGFADRLSSVYNSFSSDRTTEIDHVPHFRGLPPYDIVLAPDFAPVAGMHGIFISGNSIMSIILPADNHSGDWQIIKRKSFTTMEEMAEMVTLVAAGFDLP